MIPEHLRPFLDTLDLDDSVTEDRVKVAYKELVLVWHPDRFRDEKLKLKATEKLKEINFAYSSLIKYFSECRHETKTTQTKSANCDEKVASQASTTPHRTPPPVKPKRTEGNLKQRQPVDNKKIPNSFWIIAFFGMVLAIFIRCYFKNEPTKESPPIAIAQIKNSTAVVDNPKGLEKITPKATPAPNDVSQTLVATSAVITDDDIINLVLRHNKNVVEALSDSSPKIRLVAVHCLPPEEVWRLSKMLQDSNREVRVATAEVLGELTDNGSWRVLLGAFDIKLEGDALTQCFKSLAKRGMKNNAGKAYKDMEPIAVCMRMLKSNPGNPLIMEALTKLTLIGSTSSQREAERCQWDTDRWNKWYGNILERKVLEKGAMDTLSSADKLKDASYQAKFKQFFNETQRAMEQLEKCGEMCKDDPEDKLYYDSLIKKWKDLPLFFQTYAR